jgi:hypothetical protein
LTSHDLGKHRQVFNASSASINSMGMSEMFAVLLVATTSLESALEIAKKDMDSYSSDTICEAKTSGGLSNKRKKGSVKSTTPRAHSYKNRRSSPARGSTIQSVRDLDMLDLLRMSQRHVNETHFWPDAAFDGAATIHAFMREVERQEWICFTDLLSIMSAGFMSHASETKMSPESTSTSQMCTG